MTREEIERIESYRRLAGTTIGELSGQTPDKDGHSLIIIGSDLLGNDRAQLFAKGSERDMATILANAAGSSTPFLKAMLAAVGLIMEKGLIRLQDR